jgi:hypothetical protein
MPLIDQIIDELKRLSIQNARSVPVPTQEQIRSAEIELGIEFPPSFLVFLERAGSYKLPYWETYWVGDVALGYRNIIAANIMERSETESSLPSFLVAFQNNGCGDLSCFDTRNCRFDGEYSIVFWDHELSSAENLSNLEAVADSFTEWLETEIKTRS